MRLKKDDEATKTSTLTLACSCRANKGRIPIGYMKHSLIPIRRISKLRDTDHAGTPNSTFPI